MKLAGNLYPPEDSPSSPEKKSAPVQKKWTHPHTYKKTGGREKEEERVEEDEGASVTGKSPPAGRRKPGVSGLVTTCLKHTLPDSGGENRKEEKEGGEKQTRKKEKEREREREGKREDLPGAAPAAATLTAKQQMPAWVGAGLGGWLGAEQLTLGIL
ncbi:hypothetical protein A4A49_43764 [Nicotiana attenuata]|uniref:Uncharacterized protein n=1 Tax=Nicotiana attenuata TaxID=49451 RepID=A0A1J6K6Z3_NICAT|nr:hypothetical protein A4A49_43764 [Nicotiana attenuata]